MPRKHPSGGVDSLSKGQLSRFFLKKATEWPDGTAVVPVDQERTSIVREAFSDDVHGKGPGAIAAYWQRQIFSGRGVPPLVKGSDAQVLDYVRSTPGAIGYVGASTPTEGVKVLTVE